MSAAPLSELDAVLPGLARKIRVLDALAWPDGVEEVFLAHWRAGHAELPKVSVDARLVRAAFRRWTPGRRVHSENTRYR